MADLVAEELTKTFAGREGALEVLRGVSLALSGGENLAIVGPSGSGKSTLLYILGTLDRPTSGRILIDGQDPFTLDDRGLAAFRNRHVGFVFQDHHLLPQCTVLENVLLPAIADGPARGEDVQRAEELLRRVGLSDRLDHRPAELSGGERQRVALARAMIRRPRVLLADEPTGNLDRATALGVADLMLELQRQEHSVLVVVTHSLELAARMNRCLELREGRLVAIDLSAAPSG